MLIMLCSTDLAQGNLIHNHALSYLFLIYFLFQTSEIMQREEHNNTEILAGTFQC